MRANRFEKFVQIRDAFFQNLQRRQFRIIDAVERFSHEERPPPNLFFLPPAPPPRMQRIEREWLSENFSRGSFIGDAFRLGMMRGIQFDAAEESSRNRTVVWFCKKCRDGRRDITLDRSLRRSEPLCTRRHKRNSFGPRGWSWTPIVKSRESAWSDNRKILGPRPVSGDFVER